MMIRLQYIFIFFSIIGCGSYNSNQYKIKINSSKFFPDDTLKIDVTSNKSSIVHKKEIFLDGNKIDSIYPLTSLKLGAHEVQIVIINQGKKIVLKDNFILYAKSPPKLYSYKIINSYPHDETSYTQGLEFNNNILFESTGLRGKSKIRSLNYKTGEVIKEIKLDDNYFGEGLSILNNKIYQLTWQEDIGFIYDINLTNLQSSFSYDKSIEGWGLCNDGKVFYKSDGTNKIWILDRESLNEIDYIEIMTNKKSISKINELEWHNNKIYANTYQFDKEVVLIINPKSGHVEGVIDFSGLKNKVKQIESLNVLNGIAYNSISKTFFVTGKNWNKIFEVEFFQKDE
jgi:glutamine cyclotransferase